MVLNRTRPSVMTSDAVGDLRRLYEAAFPPKERMQFSDLAARVDAGDLLLWLAPDGTSFAVTRELPTPAADVLLEYFAVLPDRRSAGIGTAALGWLVERIPAPIVLEVEDPAVSSDPDAGRRITFYERFGARRVPLSEAYSMPNLETGDLLPMRLLDLIPMRRAAAWDAGAVRALVRAVWTESYDIDEQDDRLIEILEKI